MVCIIKSVLFQTGLEISNSAFPILCLIKNGKTQVFLSVCKYVLNFILEGQQSINNFQEYWVLMESRILLKLVLGGVRIVALSINSHEQT